MLGADHHGYIAPAYARWCRASATTRTETLEILHRPAGQSGQGRRAGPDEQARRQHRGARRPRRCDRRGRRPLRARAVRRSSRASTSTWTPGPARPNDNPVYYVQYAHARLASLQRNAAELGIVRCRRRRPRRCSTTTARPTCSRPSASSRASLRPRPNCARRTGSRTTSRRSPGTYHRFYDACRVLPMGDDAPTPSTARAAVAVRGDPDRARATVSRCSA